MPPPTMATIAIAPEPIGKIICQETALAALQLIFHHLIINGLWLVVSG